MTNLVVKDGNNQSQTLQLPSVSGSGNPQIAIAEALPTGSNVIGAILEKQAPYTSSNSSGTTSSSVNTYTQVSAANVTNRAYVRVSNPKYKSDGSANTSVLTVGLGASGSEFIFEHLDPGDWVVYSGTDRVSIKSILSASAIYLASVAVYS